MKHASSLARGLLFAAAVVFLAGLGVWAAAGARVGWTQTSTVTIQRDEITGIDYPVRTAAFLPGIEVPLAAAGLASLLAGLSRIRFRPRAASAA